MIELLLVTRVPLGLGLVPALLPGRVRERWRWAAFIAILGKSVWAAAALAGSPHGFHMIPLSILWLGLAASLMRLAGRAFLSR